MDNKPCSCGSGKKYKKCCANKRPRSTLVTLKFSEGEPIHQILRNEHTCEFEAYSYGQRIFPETTTVERSYKKLNKKANKVVAKTFSNKNTYGLTPDQELFNFDTVYGVDTNTKVVNGLPISTTGIVLGERLRVYVANKLGLNISLINCFSFTCSSDKPENFAWFHVTEKLLELPDHDKLKIGLVVDSDLGRLVGMNKREIPVFENNYLPKNFTLLYASGERDTNNPMNKLVQMADFGANVLFKEIVSSEKNIELFVHQDSVKVWTVERKGSNQVIFRC